MAPFEAMYGQRCQTPLNWSEAGERRFFRPDLVQSAEEKVKQIRESIRIAQSRQKSYADQRRRPLQFEVGEYVYLKVSPMKGTKRFGVRGKLAPRYIGPVDTKSVQSRAEAHQQAEMRSFTRPWLVGTEAC